MRNDIYETIERLRQVGDYSIAIQLCQKMLERNPQDSDLQSELSTLRTQEATSSPRPRL